MKLEPADVVYKLYHSIPPSLKHSLAPLARACKPYLQALEPPSILSAEQKTFWDNFGFLVLKGFYSKEVIKRFNEHIDYLWDTRFQHPEWPYVIFAFLGQENFHRVRLCEASDKVRATTYKLCDLYLDDSSVRSFVLNRILYRVLRDLLQDKPLLCNTLNLEWGSQQELHFDSYYMTPVSVDGLLATWVALEDIDKDSGPLRYIPGSHKIPPYTFKKSGTRTADFAELPDALAYAEAEVKKRNLSEEVFLGEAGDVFIWHAQLLHGGATVGNSACTRKSIVSHFWRCCDVANSPTGTIIRDCSGGAYLDRAHASL